MPIFEYTCGDCDRRFEAFVTADRAAECPGCHGANLVKQHSSPGMVGVAAGAGRREAPPMAGGCGAGGAGCACRTAAH
jgi:putative FmdB family regulatory protein